MDSQSNQRANKNGDPVLAALAVIMVLLLGAMEIGLLVPEALKEAHGAWDTINVCTGCVSIVLIWWYCLHVERTHLYERKEAKWHRRRGYLMQAMALGLYTVGQIQDKHPAAAAVLAVVVLLCMATWRSWLRTLALTPEQQTAIDELIEERQRRFKEHITAEQQKASEIRFAAVVSRYEVPDFAVTVNGPASAEPAFIWPIPEGKHQPLIYFVRNGDRVKIGTTTNLRTRISNLSLRTTDIVLLLDGGRQGERALHRQFAAKRVGNTEWFQYVGPVANYVETQTAQAVARKEG